MKSGCTDGRFTFAVYSISIYTHPAILHPAAVWQSSHTAHALTLIPLSIQIQPLSPLLRLMRRPTSNPFLSSFLPFIALIHLLSPLPFAHLSPASPNFPAFFHRHLPHLPQQCLYQFIFSVRQLSLNSLPYMTYLAF